MTLRTVRRRLGTALAILIGAGGLAGAAAAGPLQVAATTPDLGSLAEAVGGDAVEVQVFAKGPQDPHFVEARPSFIRSLHDADVYVQVGMELEIGWAPTLLRSARNRKVQPGAPGHVDASVVITPLEVPTTRVDRSMGDVHPYGNPHYLTDPLNGLRVAALLSERFSELRPEEAAGFRERYAAFARRLVGALVGPELVERHGAEPLAGLVEEGRLDAFLEERGESASLAGWLAAVREHRGAKAVQDHNLWPYFARRFGLELVDTLEPLPGIAPTTRHLAEVVERVNSSHISMVLSSPYFDPRHARFVAERTGAEVVEMAHQVGSREGTDDYVALIDYNVKAVVRAAGPREATL